MDAPATPLADAGPSRVVAIGASAGGLESLEQLFAQLPSDTGMAFIVTQHLSPDFRSVMQFLRVRRRRPSSSILDQLEGDLRTVVAGAVQRALKEGTSVRYHGVKIPGTDCDQRCTMSATPLAHPFVQAEQPLDRSLGGLGVGLSLARTIVELHTGTIEAHSDGPGRGAELTVRMPLLRHAAVREWRSEPAPVRGGPCRIVLVEDQADSREMLRMLLEALQHVVLEAADGAAGVRLIAEEHPDVALIDIGLPEMNGYQVAEQVRRREDLEDVLLVALTGYGAPSDVAAARQAGFDDHLIKPVELRKIEQILARRRPS